MKSLLRHLVVPIACAVLLGAWAPAGQASPVTSRFTGTVTGYQFGFLGDGSGVAFDDDNPVGTIVDLTMTYDDSFLALDLNGLFSLPELDVTGSLHLGSVEYILDSMRFFSLTFSGANIVQYRPQISATGPATSDGADFFGLLLSWAPDLSLAASPLIGFGYSSDFATTYGYLVTAGDYSVGPASQVPEPATALLLLPALALLRRRKRG